jgi:hypothetical protein
MTAQTILPANTLSSGYDVANSLRFNGSNDKLTITPGTAGNRRLWTWSSWIKRSSHSGIGGTTGETLFHCYDGSSSTRGLIQFQSHDHVPADTIKFDTGGSNSLGSIYTAAVNRDLSAWLHIVAVLDTANSTATDRQIIYVNGVRLSVTVSNQVGQNYDGLINTTNEHEIGTHGGGSYFNGYMAETVLIDGQALDPTSFGEFDEDSGIWKPIKVSGLTFGDEGFYLEFKGSGTSANASGLGADTSGNTNHFAVTNLTAVDQSTDTCTNNFATWNPLFRKGTTTPAFTEGNLKSTFDDGGANEFALTTFGVSAGKWYAEVKWTSNTGTAATATGILDMAYSGTADPNDSVTNAFGYFGSGTKNVSGTASSYGDSYADGDIIGIAIDMDNNKLYFSKNGTFQNSGDPTTGSTGTGAIDIVAGVTYGIFATDYNNQVAELNTGSPAFAISSGNTDGNGYGNFEYAVPSGYFALNTKNLAEYG